MNITGYPIRFGPEEIKTLVRDILTRETNLRTFEVRTPVGRFMKKGMALSSLLVMVRSRTGKSYRNDTGKDLMTQLGFDVWPSSIGASPITVVTLPPQAMADELAEERLVDA